MVACFAAGLVDSRSDNGNIADTGIPKLERPGETAEVYQQIFVCWFRFLPADADSCHDDVSHMTVTCRLRILPSFF